MGVPVTEVGWGPMVAGGARARVHVWRTAAERDAAIAALRDEGVLDLEASLGSLPTFDGSGDALVLVEFPDGAGSELRPVVEGIEPTARGVLVRGRYVRNPDGEMTDDVSRSWVLVRAPAAAVGTASGGTLEVMPFSR